MNASQLLLTADHIKLSLLERQRALSLKLEPDRSQEASIARSLESLREGIETVDAAGSADTETVSRLRMQYKELARQFRPDEQDRDQDQDREQGQAQQRERDQTTSPSSASASANVRGSGSSSGKNVRFRDEPSADEPDWEDEANRASLFQSQKPYTDNDDGENENDNSRLSNQQIYSQHQQIISEQDEQLDSLSASIGRQRHLAMQVGDELEGQIALLDDVDRGVDRHQGRLDGARRRLQGVGESARQNWGMTTIIILIVILVFLIAVLK